MLIFYLQQNAEDEILPDPNSSSTDSISNNSDTQVPYPEFNLIEIEESEIQHENTKANDDNIETQEVCFQSKLQKRRRARVSLFLIYLLQCSLCLHWSKL